MQFVIVMVTFLYICVESLIGNSSQSHLDRVTAMSHHQTTDHAATQAPQETHIDRLGCKPTRSGIDYNDNLSTSYTGEQCLPWSLFDNNTKSAEVNYCRN